MEAKDVERFSRPETAAAYERRYEEDMVLLRLKAALDTANDPGSMVMDVEKIFGESGLLSAQRLYETLLD